MPRTHVRNNRRTAELIEENEFMSDQTSQLADPADFSLVLGGPLYQLYLRAGLVKPPLDLYTRRIVGIALIAWLPLLLFGLFEGMAISGVEVPFLLDLDAHARFLGSLPLLIAAELIVHQRIRVTVRQFLERGIIAPEDRPQFDRIIASAMRLRNSVVLEVLLIVIVLTGGHWIWKEYVSLRVATWYAVPMDGQVQLTPAGYWYAFVSLPIVRFIVCRWYFRFFIWYRFLWQVAQLPLRLNPLHPDRAGGLGFLAGSVFAFGLVLLAHTVLLAGLIGNRIWHEGAALPEFKLEIVGIMAFLMLQVLVPLGFFSFHLAQAKRIGIREYGIVAARYVNDFRQKWIETGSERAQSLLGTADIQSLADLSNSFDVLREMRMLPFGRQTVVQLALLIALPLFPLTLTMIPLEEIVDRALGVLF
jgi:hypothetical protein